MRELRPGLSGADPGRHPTAGQACGVTVLAVLRLEFGHAASSSAIFSSRRSGIMMIGISSIGRLDPRGPSISKTVAVELVGVVAPRPVVEQVFGGSAVTHSFDELLVRTTALEAVLARLRAELGGRLRNDPERVSGRTRHRTSHARPWR